MKTTSFILLFLVYLSPLFNVLLTIPIAILALFRLSNVTPYIIASTFALLSLFLQVPDDWDLHRHIELYSTYQNSYTESTYIGLNLVFSVFNWANINKIFIPFSSAFILYFYLSKIALLAISYKDFKKTYKGFVLLLFLMSVPIILFTGLRFSTALALFSYGLLIQNKKKFFYLIAACIFHYAFLLPLSIWVLVNTINLKKINRNLVWPIAILSLLIGFSSGFIVHLLEMTLSYLSISNLLNVNKIDVYISGQWGSQYNEQLNESGMLIFNIRLLLFIGIGFLFINDYKRINKKSTIITFCYFMLIICFTLSSLADIFVRYSYLVLILIMYYSILRETTKSHTLKLINILLPIYIIYQQLYYGFFAMRTVISNSFSNILSLSYFNL
ncbi:EpsG family protein [Providencia rettgeri]|uniref:EpsG family protein n=1 Tax=Providencia rettgeri TaxID=587 RepID=UPI001CFE6457|nr:EpsG family protein [Providencia rettgeri]MCB4826232.1 EpsG family protein [Providencia rettgeri]